ncbi:hypothetical protein ACFV99_12860 [Streptomyces sp. NPDC059944]|uniref:hypothetical protein n=1 Tax=unclassified Streptomyces TaxID=2593676 RepID=UPI0036655C31
MDGDSSRNAHARHLAATFLAKVTEHGGIPVTAAAVETAQLIVGEVVSNAREYAPGPALLHLRSPGPCCRPKSGTAATPRRHSKSSHPDGTASTAWKS